MRTDLMRNLIDTIGFYAIKVIAIIIVTLLYVLVGSTTSLALNKITPEKDPKKMSVAELIIRIIIFFSCIAITYYFIRTQIKHAPQFLDGIYGFDHTRLKEASGGIVISFVMYAFHQNVKDWMIELRNRIPF